MLALIVEDVLKRSGVNQIQVGDKRRQVMRTHGFRKFFITQCDRANMNFTIREYLSGHRLPNQDAHYNLRTEEDRLFEYVKAIPLLTIVPTQRLEKKVKELEGQQTEEIVQQKERVQYLDEWVHRWSGLYHSLVAGKVTSWSSETDKTVRLKVVEEEDDPY